MRDARAHGEGSRLSAVGPRRGPARPASPVPHPSIDWAAALTEVTRHLQQLIRLDTTNPPGNELAAARYLEGVLVNAGVDTRVLEAAPGRGAVVARVRGTGERPPVLLVAHMDVVGVEREHWSVDPFAGEVRDGWLYGRGAIDDKGMLAANLETVLLLQRHVIDRGMRLARDVVLVATADEETGGEWGIEWLLDRYPDLRRAEFALNEGGRTRVIGGRPRYLAVQTAEKVPHDVRLVARGPAGHAAVPRAGNAIVRLGRALAAIGAHREPTTALAETRAFFAELARLWPDARERRAIRDVISDDPRRVARGGRALAAVPALDALLRNTISPTLVGGGVRANVIPAEAWANLNVRTLPGESIDGVAARLADVVDDAEVVLELEGRATVDAPPSPIGSVMFEAIRSSTVRVDPEIAVVPYLGAGATDNARLRARGIRTYGILPFPLELSDEERMHGHDERIPLDALLFGTRVIHGAILEVAR